MVYIYKYVCVCVCVCVCVSTCVAVYSGQAMHSIYCPPVQGELKKKDNLTAAKDSVQDELERLQVCVHS